MTGKKWAIVGLISVFVGICLPLVYFFLLGCYWQGSDLGNWLYSFDTAVGKLIIPIVFFLLVFAFIAGFVGFARLPKGVTRWQPLSLILSIGSIILIILGFLILMSLNTARVKSRNAAVEVPLATIRIQAESYYESHNFSYGVLANDCHAPNSFFTDEAISPLIAEAEKWVGPGIKCLSSGDAYAVSANLLWINKQRSGYFCPAPKQFKSYCVDSTGFAGFIESDIVGPSCK